MWTRCGRSCTDRFWKGDAQEERSCHVMSGLRGFSKRPPKCIDAKGGGAVPSVALLQGWWLQSFQSFPAGQPDGHDHSGQIFVANRQFLPDFAVDVVLG